MKHKHPYQCEICNKIVTPSQMYCYWDEERGLKAAHVCRLCMIAHIEKYYGIGDHTNQNWSFRSPG